MLFLGLSGRCVVLQTRELILDDGYSRMHATELAQRLDGSLKVGPRPSPVALPVCDGQLDPSV